MSAKVVINNKPLSKNSRDKEAKRKQRKQKFKDISIDGLMDYIEALEDRISKLEEKKK